MNILRNRVIDLSEQVFRYVRGPQDRYDLAIKTMLNTSCFNLSTVLKTTFPSPQCDHLEQIQEYFDLSGVTLAFQSWNKITPFNFNIES